MSKGWIILVVLLVALGGGGYLAAESGLFDARESAKVTGVAVRRGVLTVDVTEKGNLKAARSEVLVSELEGQSTILFLIEEGTRVEPGDLVCELDATELIERKISQEISVQNAEGAYVKSEQNLAIQKSQNESDLAAARRKLDFAREDLKKYVEGDWPQQRRGAEDDILLAEEELTRAADKLEWSRKLGEQGFITRTELEADQLAMKRAEIQLDERRRTLELLEEYDNPRQIRALEADVEEAVRELERVELQATARLVDYEASLRTDKAKREIERDKLTKYEKQIDKARITAPVAGLVVYAQEGGGRGGRDDPIAEGTSVRERQAIVTIPSSDEMTVEASLHESVIELVEVGQPVNIRIDALPGRVFDGRVRFKAILPDSNSWWANPNLRVYRCEVQVIDPDPAMRPGMSCSVEIKVDEIPDALMVPVQSVVLSGGRQVAFVRSAAGIEERQVQVGAQSMAWVQILEGLEEGEMVLLSPPEGYEIDPEPEPDEEPPIVPPAAGDADWSGVAPGGESAGARPGGARPGGGQPAGGAATSGSSQ